MHTGYFRGIEETWLAVPNLAAGEQLICSILLDFGMQVWAAHFRQTCVQIYFEELLAVVESSKLTSIKHQLEFVQRGQNCQKDLAIHCT